MKHLVFLVCVLTNVYIHSLPGVLIGYDQKAKIPIVSLHSLNVDNFKILKCLNLKNLPIGSNWQEHSFYYVNRNRTVYLTSDQKYAVKIWRKNYPSRENFIRALHAFFKGIALISALIFDEEDECRGYISPYVIDRTGNRAKWESSGFILQKGPIGVKIFSHYEVQPKIYKELFDSLLTNARLTGYVSLDFCPHNIIVDLKGEKAYLVDLEDVQPIGTVSDVLI